MMRSWTKVKQLDKHDCAAACLAAISSYYGLKMAITTIRQKCGTTIEGTNIKGILEAASLLNIEAHAYKSSSPCYTLKILSGIPVPSILHFKNEDGWLHFVVLYRCSSKYAFIMDPADGEIHRISDSELRSRWTGYIITLSPSLNFRKGDHSTPLGERFRELFNAFRGELIPALLGSVIYVLSGLGLSLYLQYAIDKIIPSQDTSALAGCATVVGMIIFFSLFIGYVRTILIIRGGIRIDGTLIMEYIRQVMHLPLPFFKERSVGEIHSRVSDIYKIRAFISGKMMIIFISVLALVCSIGLLFSFYWKLALMTLGFIPLYALLYYVADKRSKKYNKLIIESAAAFDSVTIEALSSIETVKWFSGEDMFSKRIEQKYTQMGEKLYNGGRSSAGISAMVDILTQTLTFTIITAGTIFVIGSELSTGELVSFYSVSAFFTSPVSILIESSKELNDARIAALRVFEIMDLEREEGKRDYITIPESDTYSIELKEVSFGYTGKRGLFHNISAMFPGGKVTSITGENGSGKSTIASLIMRIYEPDSGYIAMNGLKINQFDLIRWRQHISIIPQVDSLFDGSVLENITVGDRAPDIKKVMEICVRVGMIDFINSLPQGLLTAVGQNGRLLSGGERAKMAIARALYREPKILIMDEVTSHLDRSSAERIYSLTRELATGGMTIINITHDKNFLQYSDYVVNLNKCEHTQVNYHTPISCDNLTQTI